jgi:predicted porin
MKKTALAGAILCTLVGAASAQSSLVIYGKIDVGVGKRPGTTDKEVFDAGGTNTSRIGFRGTEDLGGGYAALFALEHRFRPDTGMDTTISTTLPSGRFWQGQSYVGLRTPYGTVSLGRQYTPSFSLVQNQIDPWGSETVAALRGVGMLAAPGIAATRFPDSVRYDYSAAGMNFAAAIAEGNNAERPGPDRPWSVAGNYSAGPLFVGLAYEDPAGEIDKLWNVGARYKMGPAELVAGYSRGRTEADVETTGWLVGANVTGFGPGDVKVGVGQTRIDPEGPAPKERTIYKVGAGYHYNLSKRTKLYVDVAHDREAVTSKTGYDLGIQHNF